MNKTNICLNNDTDFNYPGGYECQCQENYFGLYCMLVKNIQHAIMMKNVEPMVNIIIANIHRILQVY